MKLRPAAAIVIMAMTLFIALSAAARTEDTNTNKDAGARAASTSHNAQDGAMRLEGEKRYRANCARCHAAPPKFPPRMMATIIRHMRVRANITDEDRRLILRYMSQ